MGASPNQLGRAHTLSGQRPEFGHWLAVARDDDTLATRDPAQHLATVVTKVSDTHQVGHANSVSPVIHTSSKTIQQSNMQGNQ